METVKETTEQTIEQEALMFLEDGIQEILVDIHRAKNTLVDGKVIPCDRKLQGIVTKIENALTYIKEVRQESGCAVAEAPCTEEQSERLEG